jgi:putative Holliday junction resolvase
VAAPLTVLRRHPTRAADFAEVQALVTRERVVGVLVGLPVQGPGQTTEQQRWVLRYARRLAGVLSVPVAFWDETLSSHDAAAVARKRARQPFDDIAAALILQDFLEARQVQPGVGDI